jgi:hypothetical protein
VTRFDLYAGVHKGLRAALFEAVALAARTDFGSDEESLRAAAAVRRVLGFLGEHATAEDAVIVPELLALAPELHAELLSEHARTGGLERDVLQVVARVEGAAGVERESLGRRLCDRLARLTAEHLRHMQREEQDANRVLWAHRTDEELLALHARILGVIPPPRTAEWLGIILPALSTPERANVLRGLREKVPPPALLTLTAPARAAMGDAAWARAAGAAGLQP